MHDDVATELLALARMTVGQLRTRWEEVFGEPARSFNRQHLLKRVAWRIQSLREGGLPERARQRALELARDADLRLRPPPAAAVPIDVHASRRHAVRLSGSTAVPGLAPGCLLRREYKGQVLLVRVLVRGFEFEGEVYRSLTAIARKVTGANWSGHHFFGLARSRSREGEVVA